MILLRRKKHYVVENHVIEIHVIRGTTVLSILRFLVYWLGPLPVTQVSPVQIPPVTSCLFLILDPSIVPSDSTTWSSIGLFQNVWNQKIGEIRVVTYVLVDLIEHWSPQIITTTKTFQWSLWKKCVSVQTDKNNYKTKIFDTKAEQWWTPEQEIYGKFISHFCTFLRKPIKTNNFIEWFE